MYVESVSGTAVQLNEPPASLPCGLHFAFGHGIEDRLGPDNPDTFVSLWYTAYIHPVWHRTRKARSALSL